MKYRKVILATGILILSTSVNATLVSRLGGLAYYDDVADLTWLADANAGVGSAFDDSFVKNDGLMTWASANDWAATLNVGGVNGWRLPDSDSCYLTNCTNSEMGNLFYNVFGGNADTSITTVHNSNYGLFNNIQTDFNYWLATEYEFDTYQAWRFSMNLGRQTIHGKNNSYYAWAVHSGDVSLVPIPASAWLFGSGLIGLIGMSRRRRSS